MSWIIERTDTFLKCLKEVRNHHELLAALEKKMERLKTDPENVGGRLAGPLHGKQSTRIVGKYRLIFQVDKEKSTVYLLTIDHRKTVYEE